MKLFSLFILSLSLYGCQLKPNLNSTNTYTAPVFKISTNPLKSKSKKIVTKNNNPILDSVPTDVLEYELYDDSSSFCEVIEKEDDCLDKKNQ